MVTITHLFTISPLSFTIWKSQKRHNDESDTSHLSKNDQILCSALLFTLLVKEGLAEHIILDTGQVTLAAVFNHAFSQPSWERRQKPRGAM